MIGHGQYPHPFTGYSRSKPMPTAGVSTDIYLADWGWYYSVTNPFFCGGPGILADSWADGVVAACCRRCNYGLSCLISDRTMGAGSERAAAFHATA
jgi:hypothetical protein